MRKDGIPKNTFEFERLKNGQPILRQFDPNGRKTLFTIKFGALTSWIRDIFTIILLWKLIAALP